MRFVGFLSVLLSTSAGPTVVLAEMRQIRLVSTCVCAAFTPAVAKNAD